MLTLNGKIILLILLERSDYYSINLKLLATYYHPSQREWFL